MIHINILYMMYVNYKENKQKTVYILMLRIYELFCKPNYSKTFFSIGILQRLRFASYK